MPFAKFDSKSDRDDAVQALKGNKVGGSEVWAKEDLPIHVRVRKSVLLGMKYILGKWGYPRSQIKVDTSFTTMECNEKLSLTVSIESEQIMCTCDENWQTWEELHQSEEVKQLMATAVEQLKKVPTDGKGFSKGKGAKA